MLGDKVNDSVRWKQQHREKLASAFHCTDVNARCSSYS